MTEKVLNQIQFDASRKDVVWLWGVKRNLEPSEMVLYSRGREKCCRKRICAAAWEIEEHELVLGRAIHEGRSKRRLTHAIAVT